MKLRSLDNYLKKDKENEDLEKVRKNDRLARKSRDKNLTNDRKNKRRQKAKGYYV